ncbi:hypothetical protein E2C01_074762 [Portunus trituberculatus]|uniref:Uncharacterized protein n=1 Tax=Portunus trituberculatus TaxID=210409 RepID=A0A5B7I473_PORTR|nr:hypothetical protein [Portunus trituberculatus]
MVGVARRPTSAHPSISSVNHPSLSRFVHRQASITPLDCPTSGYHRTKPFHFTSHHITIHPHVYLNLPPTNL